MGRLLPAFAFTLAATWSGAQASQPGRWYPIGPDGGAVQALVPVPGQPGTWLAGVHGGGVYRSDDGGSTWRAPVGDIFYPAKVDPYPTGDIEISVDRIDARIVWAVVKNGGLYRSGDGGRRWALVPLSGGDGTPNASLLTAVAADPWRAGSVYVADRYGVYRSDDGGDSWEGGDVKVIDRFGEPLWIRSLTADPDQAGRLLLGATDGVFTSEDRGAAWRQVSGDLPDLVDVTSFVVPPAAPQLVFALGMHRAA